MPIEKKLFVKKVPGSCIDDEGGISSPDPAVLLSWEDKLNSSGLQDFSVSSMCQVGEFIWCVLEREVV